MFKIHVTKSVCPSYSVIYCFSRYEAKRWVGRSRTPKEKPRRASQEDNSRWRTSEHKEPESLQYDVESSSHASSHRVEPPPVVRNPIFVEMSAGRLRVIFCTVLSINSLGLQYYNMTFFFA